MYNTKQKDELSGGKKNTGSFRTTKTLVKHAVTHPQTYTYSKYIDHYFNIQRIAKRGGGQTGRKRQTDNIYEDRSINSWTIAKNRRRVGYSS